MWWTAPIWEATRDGIADVLRKLPELPPCVAVFPVCTHHFMGVDMESIYRSLEQEFPEIDFIRAWMDPIMQKHGLPPDQRLRKVMYDPLQPCQAKGKDRHASGCGICPGAGFAIFEDSYRRTGAIRSGNCRTAKPMTITCVWQKGRPSSSPTREENSASPRRQNV